jgi:two-component sensor histidine kinase
LNLNNLFQLKNPLIIFICVIGLTANSQAQFIRKVEKNPPVKLNIAKVKELQVLAFKHLNKRGIHQADLDSAIHEAQQAKLFSERLKNHALINESLCLMGESYFKAGKAEAGKDCFHQAIFACQLAKDLQAENRLWLRLYVKLTYYSLSDAETLNYVRKAKEIANRINDLKGLMDANIELGAAYIRLAKLDSAKIELFKAQEISQKIPKEDFFRLYRALGQLYRVTGNQSLALESFRKGLQNLVDVHVPQNSQEYGIFYGQIAVFSIKIDKNESYKYYRLSIENAKRTNWERANVMIYNSDDSYVQFLANEGKSDEALAMVQDQMKNFPPIDDWEKGSATYVLALCYQGQGNVKTAEEHYLQAIKYYHDRPLEIGNVKAALSRMYSTTKQFDKAQALKQGEQALITNTMMFHNRLYNELTSFQIDSANGNFKSAIEHFRKWKQLIDSTQNVEKTKQLAEIQVKYATKEKEQAIILLRGKHQKDSLERNIKAVEFQRVNLEKNVQKAEIQKIGLQRDIQRAELKKVSLQRNIQEGELRNSLIERNLQQAELQRVNTQRNITFGGIAAFMLISGLAYNGYRNKKRSNRVLETKQIEINDQNASLQKLVNEKEWLLKEVHHRVKNNLQIVMSLLSSQSAYLENTAAIEAIKESQSRVHAIALIHQKLYKSSNVASINVPAYVGDLLESLADSFDTRKHQIKFDQVIEPISLDLAQTVPLGLIINESVTNSIKYAFSEQGGLIKVALQVIKKDNLLLTISDNGKGFPDNMNLKEANSLGMEMMKSLSKQLGGEFKIEGQSGVRISIAFPFEPLLPAV